MDQNEEVLHIDIPIERREFDLAGSRISVLLAGTPGEAPPVLAVHGFGSSAQYTWQSTGHLIGLARAGRYVIAPDLLGHGHSAKPIDPAAYTLPGLVELAMTALARFGRGADPAGSAGPAGGAGLAAAFTRPADLLGYSLGSRICWEAVARGGSWRRAVLGGYDGRALLAGVDERSLRRALGDDPDMLIDSVAVQQLSPGTRRLVELAGAAPGNSMSALIAVVGGIFGTGPVIGSPQLPLMLVAGSDDPFAAGCERWAKSLPDASVLTVPRRDHVSTLPAGVFRRAVTHFLGR